jgi:hypothetical protein
LHPERTTNSPLLEPLASSYCIQNAPPRHFRFRNLAMRFADSNAQDLEKLHSPGRSHFPEPIATEGTRIRSRKPECNVRHALRSREQRHDPCRRRHPRIAP